MTLIAEFFRYARERHAVYLRRASGAPAPWTEDPILQQYRFCNIFRELDTTTAWFRESVRDPLRDKPEVLLATVVFRLFNRIATGEAIFKQLSMGGETAFEDFLETQETMELRDAILAYCGSGPYTTGSYMTKTPTGLNKLDGMLRVIEWFVEGNWRAVADDMLLDKRGLAPLKSEGGFVRRDPTVPWSLEELWSWLRRFPFIGDFTAYEIVTDLRHTALLENAPDVNKWANPGPGAKRGLNVMHGRPLKSGVRREVYIEEMMLLLEASRDPEYWPQKGSQWYEVASRSSNWPKGEWPAWELRDVEHTLCEFFKYERVRTTGQGTRQRFRGGM